MPKSAGSRRASIVQGGDVVGGHDVCSSSADKRAVSGVTFSPTRRRHCRAAGPGDNVREHVDVVDGDGPDRGEQLPCHRSLAPSRPGSGYASRRGRPRGRIEYRARRAACGLSQGRRRRRGLHRASRQRRTVTMSRRYDPKMESRRAGARGCFRGRKYRLRYSGRCTAGRRGRAARRAEKSACQGHFAHAVRRKRSSVQDRRRVGRRDRRATWC